MQEKAGAIEKLVEKHRGKPLSGNQIGELVGSMKLMPAFRTAARGGKLPTRERLEQMSEFLGCSMYDVLIAAAEDAGWLTPRADEDRVRRRASDLVVEIPKPQDRQQFVKILEDLVRFDQRDRRTTCGPHGSIEGD